MLHSETYNQSIKPHIYFISDGTPIQNFEFFRLICKKRYIKYPNIIFSKNFMLKFAYFNEFIYFSCMKYFNLKIEPFLTQTEVLKVSETHYFSINNALNELNYIPTITTEQGSQIMANYYCKNNKIIFNNNNFFRMTHIVLYILIIIGMILTGLFAFTKLNYLEISNNYNNKNINIQIFYILLGYLQKLTYLIFQTQFIIKIVFFLAIFIHFIETIYAIKLCYQLKCKNTYGLWIIQTLLLGYPSLVYLINRQKWLKSNDE